MVGTALAAPEFRDLWKSLCALLAAVFVQVACNFFNDAIDFKKGADNEQRLGPRRLTQSGRVSAQKVLRVGLLFSVLAFIAAAPLLLTMRLELWIIAGLSLAFSYLYTGGPFPLAYNGLGELFVLVFFGFVAVFGTYFLYLPQGTESGSAFVSKLAFWDLSVASLQVGLLATVLISINNLRDFETDKVAGKRTLVVLLGESYGRIQIVAALLLALSLSLYWVSRALYLPLVAVFVLVPVWTTLLRGVLRNKVGSKWNDFLVLSAQVHVLYGLSLAIGLALWRYERLFVNWILQHL
jgi:1,4-dihydroxy-2-naphthoate octaprenyltransferase